MNNIWAGSFGDQYTARNTTITLDIRALIWETLIPPECKSILEVGANIGLNLQAISTFSDAELFATEPNALAREELSAVLPESSVTPDFADQLSFPDNVADLVLTSGVLIHIPAAKLLQSMKEIHRCAKQWIIAAEYFAPQEEMIPYRGRLNALWRRDYGSIYLDNFPDLHCIAATFAWKRITGLDNLTFWVFEKGNRSN